MKYEVWVSKNGSPWSMWDVERSEKDAMETARILESKGFKYEVISTKDGSLVATNADAGRRKGKKAMAEKKQTKQTAKEIEDAAVEALVLASKESNMQNMVLFANRAMELCQRLSKTAMRRATARARAILDGRMRVEQRPQLTEHVALQATAVFAMTCDKHDVDEACRDVLFQTISTFCLWQLKQRKGPFYDLARAEGLTIEVLS